MNYFVERAVANREREAMTELGKYIKEARKERGLLQTDLSNKLGWATAQYISNIERGTCSFPLKKLKLLSKILKCDIDHLVALVIQDFMNYLQNVVFK